MKMGLLLLDHPVICVLHILQDSTRIWSSLKLLTGENLGGVSYKIKMLKIFLKIEKKYYNKYTK